MDAVEPLTRQPLAPAGLQTHRLETRRHAPISTPEGAMQSWN